MKNKIKILFEIFVIILIMFSFGIVYANDSYEIDVKETEYSEDYKKWLELDEEEKKNTIQPRKYEVSTSVDNSTYLKSLNNVFRTQQLIRATIPTEFNLKDIIPENVVIRNQMQTNSCWAFSALGMLESNLALRDQKASLPTVTYDFSERHLIYSSMRSAFLNNQINEYGFSTNISNGGNIGMVLAYLTNGMGAIDESDLPFENNEDNIDISEIQNKEVKTTLYDTKEFETVTEENKENVMQSIKEHIVNYGGVYASIYGANMGASDYYNNETGAIYCKERKNSDHSVVIIGWDDNYSRDNFNQNQKPEENGAWIVKNSWGENTTVTLLEAKQLLFEADKEGCEANNWYSAEQIPDADLLNSYKQVYGESKVKIDSGNLIVENGNEGYMYISYEDSNVYANMIGIEKATYSKDYDTIYQNDILGPSLSVTVPDTDGVNLANVFQRDSTKNEELDKVSIYTNQNQEYKVYVNPNGSSKDLKDLVEVKLKEGDTQAVSAGYHILEFEEPIRLTGDSFVVMLQIVSEEEDKNISLEYKLANTGWEAVEVNTGESFWTNDTGLNNNEWTDLATLEDYSGNLCIKAYTNDVEEQAIGLSEIYIDCEPGKTVYKEGENFDSTGMKVIARYSDNSEKEINDYEIIGGENLTEGTTTVTIRYTENGIVSDVEQKITVNKQEEQESEQEPELGEETEKPTTNEPNLSDFSNANAKITEAKLYFDSTNLSNSTGEITIKITGIVLEDENDIYSYSYYLSGIKEDMENEINDWKSVEITKENDGTYSITVNVKSNELSNYEEITESEKLYLYIKESVTKNEEPENSITGMHELEIENSSEPQCYIDGEYIGGIDDVLNYNKNSEVNGNNTNDTNNIDNTTAFGILPYTGKTILATAIILLIGTSGIIAYYRYKHIDK